MTGRGARASRAGLLALGAVATVAGAYIAVRNTNPSTVWETLRSTDAAWLALALVLLALSMAIRVLRWGLLFDRSSRPHRGPLTTSFLLGHLFNNVLPARAGEIARVVALNQRAGTPRAETTGTIVAERAYDLITILALFFLALPWLPPISWLRSAAVFTACLTAIVLAAAIVLAVWGDRPIGRVLRLAAVLPFRSITAERMDLAAANLNHGLASLRTRRLAVAALAWTSASWLAMAASNWAVMRAVGLDLNPAAGLLVVVAIAVALALPSSPAAVGVWEGATVIALQAYDVTASVALTYALVLHAVNFFPFLLAGAIALHVHVRTTRRSATSLLGRAGP